MTTKQSEYRKRKEEAGLVQLQVWCKPEHRDQIRTYAASLLAGVTSDSPEEPVTPGTTTSTPTAFPAARTTHAKNRIGIFLFIPVMAFSLLLRLLRPQPAYLSTVIFLVAEKFPAWIR